MSLFGGSLGALGGVFGEAIGAGTGRAASPVAGAPRSNQALWDEWGGDKLVKKHFSPGKLRSQFAGPAEFDPAGFGAATGAIGAGLGVLGAGLSAHRAGKSAALGLSPGAWHARFTAPSEGEIRRQESAGVAAARRGAEMTTGKNLAAQFAGKPGQLGEAAEISMEDTFRRAAAEAQMRAEERIERMKMKNEEERQRQAALATSKKASGAKVIGDLAGLIPGPGGQIAKMGTGIAGDLFTRLT